MMLPVSDCIRKLVATVKIWQQPSTMVRYLFSFYDFRTNTISVRIYSREYQAAYATQIWGGFLGESDVSNRWYVWWVEWKILRIEIVLVAKAARKTSSTITIPTPTPTLWSIASALYRVCLYCPIFVSFQFLSMHSRDAEGASLGNVRRFSHWIYHGNRLGRAYENDESKLEGKLIE